MADKLKTSLNLDAELMKKVRVKAAINDRTVTEELEEAIKKHVEDINLKSISKK